jgi:hypothetical protein
VLVSHDNEDVKRTAKQINELLFNTLKLTQLYSINFAKVMPLLKTLLS